MKSRLISLLSTFDQREIKQFKKFVNSEYFNTDKKISELLNLVVSSSLKKETLDDKVQVAFYNKLYPGNKCERSI